MILENIKHLLTSERVITINNSEDLEKLVRKYDEEYYRYRHPENFRELLEVKRTIAFYHFYAIITGRLRKGIVLWHCKNSKLYFNGD